MRDRTRWAVLGCWFFLIQANVLESKSHLFDARGAHHGRGDVVGPLYVLLDLQARLPQDDYYLLVDDYAKRILELSDLSFDFLHLLHESEVSDIPIVDFAYQLFIGGRWIHAYEGLCYLGPETVVFIADTMHGDPHMQVLFDGDCLVSQGPGVGSERAGIVENPALREKELDFNQIKLEPETQALIHTFISDKKYASFEESFLYGVHNEGLGKKLHGQSREFLNQLYNLKKNKILVWTPNKREELEQAQVTRSGLIIIVDKDNICDLKRRKKLPPILIISLGHVSNELFVKLLSRATVPVLIEGNMAMTAALRLEKPFFFIRSYWNGNQLKDFENLENSNLTTRYFHRTYCVDDVAHFHKPYYKDALRHLLADPEGKWVQMLNRLIPSFADSLVELIELIEELRNGIPKKPGFIPACRFQNSTLALSCLDWLERKKYLPSTEHQKHVSLLSLSSAKELHVRSAYCEPLRPYGRRKEDPLALPR